MKRDAALPYAQLQTRELYFPKKGRICVPATVGLGVDMITLTAPDGSSVRVDAAHVVRARRTISGERSGEDETAQTRVDWEITLQEPIEEAAFLIKAELSSFTCLTT